MTPLVSVMIPSRSRPWDLLEAVTTLLAKAANPHGIEVLIRIDSDQEEMYRLSISQQTPGIIFVGPRGRGYDDLHLMYNQLAANAKGLWLFQFNDDMRMLTQDWDTKLLGMSTHPTVCLVNPYDNFGRPTTIHPFVRRAGINAIGHFSLNPFCDAWVGSVYGSIGATVDCPDIQIEHLRDQKQDDVVESQRQSTGWSHFNDPEAAVQRGIDAAILHHMRGPA